MFLHVFVVVRMFIICNQIMNIGALQYYIPEKVINRLIYMPRCMVT